jgi:hypothetical protein
MRCLLLSLLATGCLGEPVAPGPDGVHRTWHRRTDAEQPGPLASPRLAYDSKRQRVFMYGGSDDNTSTPTDRMYELDDTGWTKLCDPCTRVHNSAGGLI